MDATTIRRRFLLLCASRWLPTGVTIPVLVVLLQERGLSLATIGLLTALSSAVVALLELPTGGLADTLGRRPVLLAAGVLSLLSMTITAFSGAVALFALAWCVEGIYRALDSGPLEAWYVDSVLAADPDADIESGLAAESTAISAAIVAGALVGGAAALLPALSALPALALPMLVAIVLRSLDLIATWVLLDEPPGDAATAAIPRASRLRRAAGSARASGRTVREALRLLRGSSALAALAAVELFWGAGMTGVEVLSGPRMVELVGDASGGVAAYALTAAAAWTISGLGAAAAPYIARRTGSWLRAAIVARIAQGAGVTLAVLVAGPAGLFLGYAGFYLVHGTANVAHYGLVHRHTSAAHRATMVSVNSLSSRIGGVAAAPALGALAAGQGLVTAFAVSALLLVLPAPLYLLARTPGREDPSDALRFPAPTAAS
ncbi:MAG: MFS transporter [Sporichthyaceae bacterium]